MARIRPPVLRHWLQSSALVAVLAGYGLLLSAGSLLSLIDRRQAHQQLVRAIEQDFSGPITPAPSQLATLQRLGVEVRLEPAQPSQPPRLSRHRDGSTWLSSRSGLRRAGRPPASLLVRQNVTTSIERERKLLLLLLAAAGLASLFTSALLRQVLQRGLVIPIEAFCRQLQQISRPSQALALLPEAEQPRELQPIAAAFNQLQQRLTATWERERTFTDGVAHELRTPITLIAGQAESLLRQPLPPPQREGLQAIAAEARHMTALVRDLLDLARQDSQRLQLRCQVLDPEALDTGGLRSPALPRTGAAAAAASRLRRPGASGAGRSRPPGAVPLRPGEQRPGLFARPGGAGRQPRAPQRRPRAGGVARARRGPRRAARRAGADLRALRAWFRRRPQPEARQRPGAGGGAAADRGHGRPGGHRHQPRRRRRLPAAPAAPPGADRARARAETRPGTRQVACRQPDRH